MATTIGDVIDASAADFWKHRHPSACAAPKTGSDSTQGAPSWYQPPMRVSDLTDPKLDRWLRKQPPKLELALRYAVRGRFRNFVDRRPFDVRANELFAALRPSEDEYAAILHHAREIGEAMERELAG